MIKTSTIGKYLGVFCLYLLLMAAYSSSMNLGLLNLDMYTKDLSGERVFFSVLLILLISTLLPGKPVKASEYYLWIHAVMPTIPGVVFFSYSGGTGIFMLISLLPFLVFSFFSKLNIPLYLKPVSITFLPHFIFFLVIFSLIYISRNDVYSHLNFSIEDLYSNRADISKSHSIAFEYLHPLLSKSLIPILMVYFSVKKRFLSVIVCCFLMFFTFLLTMHRAVLFIPIFVILMYYLSTLVTLLPLLNYAFIFSLLVIIAIFLLYSDLFLLGDLFLRRTFFVPPILNYEYFKFFENNPHTWFTDSKITMGLWDPIYKKHVPYIIGDEIGLKNAHANSSYLGSGYQQAGLLGVIIYTSILVVVLKILDDFGRLANNHSFVFAVSSPGLLWANISSDLPSVLLTHGLTLSIILLWCFVGRVNSHSSNFRFNKS